MCFGHIQNNKLLTKVFPDIISIKFSRKRCNHTEWRVLLKIGELAKGKRRENDTSYSDWGQLFIQVMYVDESVLILPTV